MYISTTQQKHIKIYTYVVDHLCGCTTVCLQAPSCLPILSWYLLLQKMHTAGSRRSIPRGYEAGICETALQQWRWTPWLCAQPCNFNIWSSSAVRPSNMPSMSVNRASDSTLLQRTIISCLHQQVTNVTGDVSSQSTKLISYDDQYLTHHSITEVRKRVTTAIVTHSSMQLNCKFWHDFQLCAKDIHKSRF